MAIKPFPTWVNTIQPRSAKLNTIRLWRHYQLALRRKTYLEGLLRKLATKLLAIHKEIASF